jgi:hypothetical protein
MSEFAIGQRIVCVCDDWKNAFFGLSVRETGERYPVKDGIYTVIGHDWLMLADRPGVIIAEVNNDCIWAEQNFRLIEPRKTDISVFQKLLVNPKKKVDA